MKAAVRDAIGSAARAQGWTIAELAGQLGVGVSTLHRWKSSKSTTLELSTLVEIFRYAGLSMDQAFGLEDSEGLREVAGKERGSQLTAKDRGTLQTLLGLTKALGGITGQIEETIEGSLDHGDSPQRVTARQAAVSALSALKSERTMEEQEHVPDAGVKQA